MLKNNPRAGDDTIFASVLADGKIHVTVPEGTEGATKREYATDEDKKSGDKTKMSGMKWELIYTELSGFIKTLAFHEGDYGVNLQIVVGEDDDEKPVTLSLNTESNFAEDLMKKLPSIDMTSLVTLIPYAFDNDKGKKQRGITVQQENKKGEKVKVLSFYFDPESKTVVNGYPEPPTPKEGKVTTKSQWRKYFAEVREFLIEDITTHFGITESDQVIQNRKFKNL